MREPRVKGLLDRNQAPNCVITFLLRVRTEPDIVVGKGTYIYHPNPVGSRVQRNVYRYANVVHLRSQAYAEL